MSADVANTLPLLSKRGTRAWLPWAAALLALVLVVAGVRYRAATAVPKPKFDTVAVDRGRIFAKVTASGTLSALVTVQVGSQVSGRLAKIYVDYNSPVRAGQLVAKIDPQLFQASLEQSRANYLAAQASLKKSEVQAKDADRQYERNKSLAAEHLVAQADLDTAQANADAAHAQVDASAGAVEQARATLHQAEVNLEYTKIISPIDGVVISRNVDVGQTVAAAMTAPVLFTVAQDLRRMQVDTTVSEADIGKLRAGMNAYFSVDAYPGEHFKGSVRQIRHAATTTQNVVTYDAVLDVENPEMRLEPGMTANVTFVYAEKDEVLRVPAAALRFKPDPASLGPAEQAAAAAAAKSSKPFETAPNQRAVWVLRDNQPHEVRIVTGVSDGSLTEVQSGALKAGDALIIDTLVSAPRKGPF